MLNDISPLRLALGAGLGRALAEPIVSERKAASALNPVPLINTVSSTSATVGVIVNSAMGVAKLVVVPKVLPIIIVTCCISGANEPPVIAAGTSVTAAKLPSNDVVMPPDGIALEPPMVKVDAAVFGGNPEPVIVIIFPVDALVGVITIAP